MKRFNKEILPFGAICRQWRKRCGITASEMARIIGARDQNDIYIFEGGHRASLYMLSGYIKAGCDITLELTRSNKKCGDCKNFEDCKYYVTADESFPEVDDGCPKFERKE